MLGDEIIGVKAEADNGSLQLDCAATQPVGMADSMLAHRTCSDCSLGDVASARAKAALLSSLCCSSSSSSVDRDCRCASKLSCDDMLGLIIQIL